MSNIINSNPMALAMSTAPHHRVSSGYGYRMPYLGAGRRRRMAGRLAGGARRRRGKGFFGNIWNGLKKVGNFIKDNHVISSAVGLLPGPYAKAGALGARLAGLGRRRRRVRRGGNLLSKARSFIGKHKGKLALGGIGGAVLAHDALQLLRGSGRKRRTRRRRGGNTGTVAAPPMRDFKNALAPLIGNTKKRSPTLLRRVFRPIAPAGTTRRRVLNTVDKFLRGTKLVSAGLDHLGRKSLANAARAYGYGRRKRVVRRKRGGTQRLQHRIANHVFGRIHKYFQPREGQRKNLLHHAHDFIKDRRLISRGLAHLKLHGPAQHAFLSGYGRRRRRVVRRRRM